VVLPRQALALLGNTLLHATRDGRYTRYAVHFDGMRKLTYLTEDCCQAARALRCGFQKDASALY
jgi:hypothetical protein